VTAKSFRLTVVTPEGKALEADATSVVFPAYDGEMGILPNHAPLLTQMGIGLLRVTAAGGERHQLYVDGGFAQMVDNRLTLLTEQAMPPGELVPEHAERIADQWRDMTCTDEENHEAKQAALERARVQKRLARQSRE
jgi:F-type H+-transporting ATPase subunit epsilon